MERQILNKFQNWVEAQSSAPSSSAESPLQILILTLVLKNVAKADVKVSFTFRSLILITILSVALLPFFLEEIRFLYKYLLEDTEPRTFLSSIFPGA